MSQKPWPLPAKSDGGCGQELKPLPQTWPQWPSKTEAIDCGQQSPQPLPQPWPSPVNCGQTAKAEIEIDNTEVVPFKHEITSAKQVTRNPNGNPNWIKGVSANPVGRPKGSKHKITELARSIVAEDFAEHGRATLARVRLTDPVAYLQIVLKFVPRELILKQEQGKLIDYSHLANEDRHEELNKFVKERDNHAKIESIVDELDTKYKKF
jgi:hypothetical protein